MVKESKMPNQSPKIILLEIVKNFENYLRLLGEAERMVKIFNDYQLQVAVQKFRFIRLHSPIARRPKTKMGRSPIPIPADTGHSVSHVIMMTHETDMHSGECFSFLGGKYFLEKLKPALKSEDYVVGLYLN